jgi:hypothetical protein
VVPLNSLTPFQNELLEVVVIGVTIPLAAVIVFCLLLAWIFSLGDYRPPSR